jgi:hypothetical protein
VLAVLRSLRLERPSDAELFAGAAVDPGTCWTEAYGPDDVDMTEKLVKRIASDVDGIAVEMGAGS